MIIMPITRDHLDATNKKLTTVQGLKLRAEYCQFMAATASNEDERKLWTISAEKRGQDANDASLI